MTLSHFEQMESYIPIDLLSWQGLLAANAVILVFIVARYFMFVGMFYFSFWKQRFLATRLDYLHDQKTRKDQVWVEIRWSLISSFIFGFSGYLIGVLWQLGWTQLYLPYDQYTLFYLPLSFVIFSLVHEVYFYFTHVWMHHPRVYRKIHAVHHFSVKTSPWASFSFHPGETLVHALFLPVMVCLVPIHPVVLIAYLTFMTLTAISNHLGVELIPSRVFQKYFISGTHHSIHHSQFNYNYGLYYRFLDQWMKTEKMEKHL